MEWQYSLAINCHIVPDDNMPIIKIMLLMQMLQKDSDQRKLAQKAQQASTKTGYPSRQRR